MTGFTYIGNGEYFEGVPMRDLDDEDLARLTDEQRAVVQASQLYTSTVEQLPPDPPQAPAEHVDEAVS